MDAVVFTIALVLSTSVVSARLAVGIIEQTNISTISTAMPNISDYIVNREIVKSSEIYSTICTAKNLEIDGIDLLLVDKSLLTDIPGWKRVSSYLHYELYLRYQNVNSLTTELACQGQPMVDKQKNNRWRIKSLASLMKQDNWTVVTILYDDSTKTDATLLQELLHKELIQTLVYDVGVSMTSSDLSVIVLDAYREMMPTKANFLLFCGYARTSIIISEIEQLAAMEKRRSEIGHFSRWLVVIDEEWHGITLDLRSSEVNNLAFVLWKNIVQVLQQYQGVAIIPETNGPRTVMATIQLLLQEMALLNDCSKLTIMTLLWKEQGRQLSCVSYTYFVDSIVIHDDLFPNVKFGFNRRTLTVATNLWEPFVMKRTVDNTTQYFGLCMDLVDHLSKMMNFTYVYEIPPDGQWGKELNGSWTGLVGQLERLDADMTVAPLTMLYQRESVMDFVPVPYYNDYTSVMLKRLDPNLSKWRTLTDPLKWEVHLSICLSLPVMAIILYAAETINPYYRKKADSEIRKRDSNKKEIFWYLLASLFYEGGTYMPRSLTARTLVSTWWIFCIIIVGIYSAKLIAFLTVPKIDVPFKNLEELAAQTDYTWGTLGGTSQEQVLSDSNLEIYRKLWKGIIKFKKTDPDVLHFQASVHMDKVQKGGYAFIGDGTAMEIRMGQDCDLLTTGERFMPLMYAVGLINNSPFKKTYTEKLLAITEFGLIQRWKLKWWPRGNKCLQKITVGKAIGMVDIQSIFYVAIVMIFITFCALACEIVANKCIYKIA